MQKIVKWLDEKKMWPVADVVIFCLITAFFHKLWWANTETIFSIPGFSEIADKLATIVFRTGAAIDAKVFGMDITLFQQNIIQFNYNNTSMQINESCSGFKQMYQVFVLFLFFPGPWRQKLWFIPLGMFLMLLVNIVRVVALSFILINWPADWNVWHLWILRPMYYVVIFGLWVLWVEKFGGLKRYFAPPAESYAPSE